jgi:uncharacterized membrane protein YbaN (DUF454 family)
MVFNMKKLVLIIAGLILLGIGAIGVVLPILPTVPFLLLASLCFVNSSTRINEWFKKTKIYKKHVVRFKEQKGMTLKAKLTILIPVYIMLIMLCILKDILAMRIVIGVLLLVKTIVFIKIKTIKEPSYDDK